ASGLLGKAAYDGGAATALLGLAVHFLIAFAAATVFVLASERLPALRRAAVGWGLAFGVAVFALMSFLVLPLSTIRASLPPRPPPFPGWGAAPPPTRSGWAPPCGPPPAASSGLRLRWGWRGPSPESFVYANQLHRAGTDRRPAVPVAGSGPGAHRALLVRRAR